MKRKTTEEFIREAKIIHGDKYDYSKVVYTNSNSKVTLVCKMGHTFVQRSSAHISGQGCNRCDKDSRKNKVSDFIELSSNVHGNKYDYSKVVYTTARIGVIICCSKHGDFTTTPYHHSVRKQGCSECKKLGKENFIIKSNIIHDNRYLYDLVEYTNNKTKVKIICKIHGVFNVRVKDHMCGIGCRTCFLEKIKKSQKDFLSDCLKVHGDRYEYHLVDYLGNKIKVKIVCKIHGTFEQKPNSHIGSRNGCPKCKKSKGEIHISSILVRENKKYLEQYSFIDCKYINVLKYDFYLPEYNVCIEYNGRQHYEEIKHFGGKESFDIQITRDNIKSNYCIDNNIQLFIIKYDEDIELRMMELLISLDIL